MTSGKCFTSLNLGFLICKLELSWQGHRAWGEFPRRNFPVKNNIVSPRPCAASSFFITNTAVDPLFPF